MARWVASPLDHRRPRRGVVAGRRPAGGLQPFGQPAYTVGVFGVDHGQGALAPGQSEDLQHFPVVQLQVVIGHIDLEGRVAVTDEGRQFLAYHLLRGIADDEVEGVIDEGLALGPAVVVVDRLAERVALYLAGEGDDRGRPAAGGGDGTGAEVVGHSGAVGHELVEVAMAVHAPRQDKLAGGVDVSLAGTQVFRQGDDPSPGDTDVAGDDVRCRGHPAVADHEVEIGHGSPLSYARRFMPYRRTAGPSP